MEECLRSDGDSLETIFQNDEDKNEDHLTTQVVDTDIEQGISNEKMESDEENVATPQFLEKGKVSK